MPGSPGSSRAPVAHASTPSLPDWARNRKLGVFFQAVALFFPELLFPPIGLFLAILRKMKNNLKLRINQEKIKDFPKKDFRNFRSSQKIF